MHPLSGCLSSVAPYICHFFLQANVRFNLVISVVLFKYWCVFLIFLTSCDDGTYAFQGMPAQTVRHKNMKFDIRVRGQMIEALRLNSMTFPSTRQVRPIALQAMRQVLGCEDVAIIWADPSVTLGFHACDV